MFFDYYYIFWVLPAVIFAIWASARVSATFQKYSAQLSHLGLSGSQAARKVLEAAGVYQVQIEKTGGSLTDHYDPRTNIIRLSDSVCDRTSTAAIGVAAHEAGHAIQYAQGYLPIKIRNAIIPVTNIGSRLAHSPDPDRSAFCRRGRGPGESGLSWGIMLWTFYFIPADHSPGRI